MANPEIAMLIATSLGKGLPHPGRPDLDEPARLFPLAAFRTAGMPPEMREHIESSSQVVGEAIVNLIETVGNTVLVPRDDLDKLRAADDQPGNALPVVCRTCRETIVWLSVTNGRALVSPHLLASADLKCPHTLGATP